MFLQFKVVFNSPLCSKIRRLPRKNGCSNFEALRPFFMFLPKFFSHRRKVNWCFLPLWISSFIFNGVFIFKIVPKKTNSLEAADKKVKVLAIPYPIKCIRIESLQRYKLKICSLATSEFVSWKFKNVKKALVVFQYFRPSWRNFGNNSKICSKSLRNKIYLFETLVQSQTKIINENYFQI